MYETIFLSVLFVCCFCLSIFRFIYSDTKTFLFLNWNLFLAFIPWVLSTIAVLNPKLTNNKISAFLLLTIWLLFFPNAPYILTDLFHLKMRGTMPIWLDLVLILSFAWTGLLLGFLSLFNIEGILRKWFKKTTITMISIFLLFLGSFGIYLGRYLRWNSWDIITEPFKLFYDIGERIINPFEHYRTWGMTFFMGLFLTLIYFSFRVIHKRKSI